MPNRREPVVRSFSSDGRERRLLIVSEEGWRVPVAPFLTDPDGSRL